MSMVPLPQAARTVQGDKGTVLNLPLSTLFIVVSFNMSIPLHPSPYFSSSLILKHYPAPWMERKYSRVQLLGRFNPPATFLDQKKKTFTFLAECCDVIKLANITGKLASRTDVLPGNPNRSNFFVAPLFSQRNIKLRLSAELGLSGIITMTDLQDGGKQLTITCVSLQFLVLHRWNHKKQTQLVRGCGGFCRSEKVEHTWILINNTWNCNLFIF